MKVDLDEVERKAQAICDWAHSTVADGPLLLALVAHIRALETAAIKAAETIECWVSSETQYDGPEDDPDYQQAARIRELVSAGVVLP